MLRTDAVQGRHVDAQTLLDVARALSSQLELVPLIGQILDRAASLLKADRASLFLVDRERGELWSKVAQGLETQEIRFPIDRGISGHVATTGQTLNSADAYTHPLFNPEIDQRTGYHTRTILCAPIRNQRADIIGVLSAINRREGTFTEEDVAVLQALGGLLAVPLENSILYEEVVARQQEVSTLLDVGQALAQTLELGRLIEVIMRKAREIMDAERSSLFLIDRHRQELWSKVAEGVEASEIRFPLHQGIAGHVATTGETLNIADAYQHPLFNPEVDQKTGYHTRTILCMPIRDTDGAVVGVTQVINKRAGRFTGADERMLAAISAQAAVAIDNAQLYERVRGMKVYLESILQSLSNGVLTVDGHGRIASVNASAARIVGATPGAAVEEGGGVGLPAAEFLGRVSADLPVQVAGVRETGRGYVQYDVDARSLDGKALSLNVNVVPLLDRGGAADGVVVVLEDITREKRVKSSLRRYMSKDVADRLMADDSQLTLGGVRQEVSVLFSDIRSYTALTERADAHQVVEMLNEYFTYMVDVVFHHGGILDKFIGDAIMAVFGAPFARPDVDPVNAVLAALDMQAQLAVYNEERRYRQQRPIDIGIGISTGEVICGNIGSEKRMDYTAIGDGVNLASRLESATKQYGARIMISEFTRDKVAAGFVTRELDRIRVKGKQHAVRVYDVLARQGETLPSATALLLDLHDRAMESYRRRSWAEALARFEQGRAAVPGDAVFGLYGARCRHFLEHPPAPDWDGVWDLKEK
jgi:adenylate cyclase